MTANAKAMPAIATVPKLWPGSTVVCLGSGPSLTPDDVDACRGRARVIAIKDTIQLAPWADVLYSCGADIGRWWQRHGDSLAWFEGLRYTLDHAAAKWATVLRNTGALGLETDPGGLRTGKNSGFQSIGLARHLGAKRILLLGFDMEGTQHFFGPHPDRMARPNLREFAALFDTIAVPLKSEGVDVINCSRETQLMCFRRMTLADAFSEVDTHAAA